MNKILFSITLVSFSLNIYQYIMPAKQANHFLDNVHETQVSSESNSEHKTTDQNNNVKIEITNKTAVNTPISKKVDDLQDKFAFEKINDSTKSDVETFLIRDLNFNIGEVSEIFNIIKKSDNEFKEQITRKQKKLEGLYDESYGYIYDPEDYILMGKKRLESRALIKNLIGDEKYKKFLIYIRDYNHGKYSESFIPIEF